MRTWALPWLLIAGCGHTAAAAGASDGGEPRGSAPAHIAGDAAPDTAAPGGTTCPPDAGVAEARAAGLHLPVDDGVIEIRLRVYLRSDGSLDCATLFSTEDPGLDGDCFAMVEGESWRPQIDAQGNPRERWITYLCQFRPRTPQAGTSAGDDAGS